MLLSLYFVWELKNGILHCLLSLIISQTHFDPTLVVLTVLTHNVTFQGKTSIECPNNTCRQNSVYKLLFLPFVANADRIQKQHTKEWSDRDGWWSVEFVTGLLQTRTRSLPMTSVASKAKNVPRAEGRHSDLAASNSLEMARRFPKTLASVQSCNN